MTWMEKNFNNDMSLIRKALENKFEEYYHRSNENQRFLLPDGTNMEIDILSWENDPSFVMDYRSNTDWDDGDQYFPSDYASFDELFADMLAETQKTDEDFIG